MNFENYVEDCEIMMLSTTQMYKTCKNVIFTYSVYKLMKIQARSTETTKNETKY